MTLRRYVNVLMANHHRRIYSLRRLKCNNFFFPTEESAKAQDLPRLSKVPPRSPFGTKANGNKKKKQAAASDQVSTILPPPPIVSVRPSPCPTTRDDEPKLKCFPLSESKIFFADSAAYSTIYDTDSRCIITTPNLHAPKRSPLALSVPSPGPGGEQDGGDGSLYIMDAYLHPEKSFQFEALVCRQPPNAYSARKTWHCDTLPLPPFVHEPGYKLTSISSYAVVGDVICISAFGVGTFCFDTVSRKWSRAGEWAMPFFGKAEYAPELKLWFGVCADDVQIPCAADLSPVVRGHAPEQRYVWGNPGLPEEWRPSLYEPASIVSLGSGKFCITHFFEVMEDSSCSSKFCYCMDDERAVSDSIAVFTGLEVLARSGNGKGPRMIKHKSRRCRTRDTSSIESVF